MNPSIEGMNARYVVISTDSHDEPPTRPDKLLPYVENRHRDEFKAWLDANPPQPSAIHMGRHGQDYAEGVEAMFKAKEQTSPEWVDSALAWSRYQELPDMTDPVARTRHVEQMGVVAEVINPSSSLWLTAAFQDREMLTAARWAYIRWFADYCSAVPGRLAGTIPMEGTCRAVSARGHDLDTTLAQIRWGRENGLFGGAAAPSPGRDVPEIYDPYWEPLWALCSELALPVVFHGGCHGPLNTAAPADFDRSALAIAYLESGFQSKRNFWHLMVAGVLDRYPDLKLVFIEQHVTAVPGILLELDHCASTLAPNAGTWGVMSLKMLPSEYWQRHCLFGAPFLRPEETEYMRNSHIGLHTMTWGSDYPHIEGVYPDFSRGLRYAFGGTPEPELREILGKRAAAVFGFDYDALQQVADRCGPTVEQLASSLSSAEIPRHSFSGAYEVDYSGA